MTETLQKTLKRWVEGRCQDLRVEHPLTYTKEQVEEFKEYFYTNIVKFDALYRFITTADNITKKNVGDTIKYNFISMTKSDIINGRHHKWNEIICGSDFDKIVVIKNCYGLDISDFVRENCSDCSYQEEVIFFGECRIIQKTKKIITAEQVNLEKLLPLFDEFKQKQDVWWKKVHVKENDIKEYKNTLSF